MDRNSIIGYVLIFVIFAGWLMYSSNQQELQRQAELEQQDSIKETRAAQQLDSIQNAATTQPQDSSAAIAGNDTSAAVINDSVVVAEEKVAEIPEEIFSLENNELKLSITSKGGIVHQAQLKDYKRADSTELLLIDPANFNFSYTIPVDGNVVETQKLDFQLQSQSDSTIILEHKFDFGGSIEQQYSLENKYLVDYKIRLVGLDDHIQKRHSTYDLTWNMNLPKQERELDNEKTVSTVYYKYKSDGGVDNLSTGDNDEEDLQAGLHWVSFKQQFFMSTIIFPEGLSEAGTRLAVNKPEDADYVANMSASMSIPYGFNKNDEQNMKFYFGPNHYQTLKRLDVDLQKTIELGPSIFSWVNKLFVIPVFNWLSKFISSYGVIILLLTLFMKLILIVPMYKSYLSTAKMRILRPELEKIKEKTGGDMAKTQQEQMKLYKKVGVSPFGGCLPQLVQLPILIALFRFFPSSIELRQKSFLWASDLSTYDSWISFGSSIWPFGDHISLFTLLMAASSLLYTIYSQQTSVGMNNQMKYIMYLMPVLLFFWFNSYAAGLSYYYFLANMITFGQNFIFRKWIVDEDKIKKQMEANKNKKVAVKKSRFQKRLEDMAKKRGIDPNQVRRK